MDSKEGEKERRREGEKKGEEGRRRRRRRRKRRRKEKTHAQRQDRENGINRGRETERNGLVYWHT